MQANKRDLKARREEHSCAREEFYQKHEGRKMCKCKERILEKIRLKTRNEKAK